MNRSGLALACQLIAAAPVAVLAEPLKFEPGKPLTISCETQAVVVAPEAATTKGVLRLRLDPKEPGTASVWSVLDLDAAHSSSFAARHREGCATGCPLENVTGPKVELWAPKKALPAAQPATESLTIATLDISTLQLRASTFLANDIAALEQGTCAVVP